MCDVTCRVVAGCLKPQVAKFLSPDMGSSEVGLEKGSPPRWLSLEGSGHCLTDPGSDQQMGSSVTFGLRQEERELGRRCLCHPGLHDRLMTD